MPLGMLGKYERIDVLGSGVSGIVYLAKDTLLNKQVALKEVDAHATDARRILEEARLMDRLQHPNIVQVYGADMIDKSIVIAMEFVRGENLQQLLRAEGPLPLSRALDIAIQTLDALAFAHSVQIIHRDIKPANILIRRDGVVKLGDFGLAEILATNAYAGGAGTYAYMAPEDFSGDNRSDHLSDIWATGITLYEMLTLERPFRVPNPRDPFAWKRILENEPYTPIEQFLPTAPAALRTILDRALAKDKRDRYADAATFRDVLKELQSLTAEAGETYNAFDLPSRDPRDYSDTNWQDDTPGLLVAEVVRPAEVVEKPLPYKPLLSRFGRKELVPHLHVTPDYMDFGKLHKGDARSLKAQLKISGLVGHVHGKITTSAEWLTVSPSLFDRTRQKITVSAKSGAAWETGEFHEMVRIESNAGEMELPVRLIVLKQRPSFFRVAFWYIPLYVSAIAPAAISVSYTQLRGYNTAACAASAGLALMMVLTSIAADIGLAERIAAGVMAASMCVVLGMMAQSSAISGSSWQQTYTVLGVMGALLFAQLISFKKWRFWTVCQLLMSIAISFFMLRRAG